MYVDVKESRAPALIHGEDVIHYIESVCNGCRSQSECTVTKTFSVLDRCENFRDNHLPLIRDTPRQHSVFVSPNSQLYQSIAREIPEGRLHSNNEGKTAIITR